MLASLNERAFQKLQGSRASLFATLDAPALSPLPAQPWQWATFKTVRVHIDYHVEVDGHRYSVPHALVGLELEARLTDALIEMLHRGQLVACHARNARLGGFSTRDEHMPAAHRAHKQWTPERLIHWGADIGANSGVFVTQLLQRFRHPGHGYRSGSVAVARIGYGGWMTETPTKTMNDALSKVVKRLHYPLEVMLQRVRWYAAYPLSLRNLEEMMAEGGVAVDHTTVHRWAVKMLPVLALMLRRRKRPVGFSWRMAET